MAIATRSKRSPKPMKSSSQPSSLENYGQVSMAEIAKTTIFSNWKNFSASPRVSVHSLGEGTAIFYVEIYMSLRAEGKPIPTNDLWIAAATLETGSILLSGDAHFDAVRGLIRR